jgi:acyl-CoA thioester hydrolase
MYIESTTEIEVRYYETDQMGIVHHSNYIRYFECGRHKFLIDVGLPIMKIEELGVMMPVVSVECKYKTPARMGDILKVVSRVEKEVMARVEVLTDIFNQRGELVCTGCVVLGFLNKSTGRPTRAPKYFLDAFNSHDNKTIKHNL